MSLFLIYLVLFTVLFNTIFFAVFLNPAPTDNLPVILEQVLVKSYMFVCIVLNITPKAKILIGLNQNLKFLLEKINLEYFGYSMFILAFFCILLLFSCSWEDYLEKGIHSSRIRENIHFLVNFFFFLELLYFFSCFYAFLYFGAHGPFFHIELTIPWEMGSLKISFSDLNLALGLIAMRQVRAKLTGFLCSLSFFRRYVSGSLKKGLEFAAWYWQMIDIVWLFVLISIVGGNVSFLPS